MAFDTLRGKKGGAATGKNPTDRGKPGTKRHVVVDRRGLPLVAGLTGAERPDATVFEALVAAIPAVKQPNGRRRGRPAKLHADKGYDVRHCRRYLHRRGIGCRIARKGIEDKARLGRHRWVVEIVFPQMAKTDRLALGGGR